MSKRIVVGLDPSNHSKTAQQVACARAKLFDATVIAMAVIDTKGIQKAAAGGAVGAGHHAKKSEAYHLEQAKKTAKELIDRFREMAKEAGVAHELIISEGNPFDRIAHESAGADLVIIGTRTFFHYETQDAPGDTLREMLHARVCPLLVVPEKLEIPECVIFAYDGSTPAARAMRTFNYLSAALPMAQQVVLLTVNDDEKTGAQLLEMPAKYLEAHGRVISRVVLGGSPKKVVREFAQQHMPCIVAVGASSKGAVTEFFMGGLTKELIEDGSIPMFIAG